MRNSIAHPRQKKENGTDESVRSIARDAILDAKERFLPLRIKQTIRGGLTTKRRRFGDRYFRSGRFPPPYSHSCRLSVAYSATCISDFTRNRSARNTAARFVEAEVRQKMSKSAGRGTLAARHGTAVWRTEAPSFVLLAARNGRMLPIIHAAGRAVNYDCRVHHRPRAH